MQGNNNNSNQPLYTKGHTENRGKYIWRFGTLEQELHELFRVRINPGVIGKLIVLIVGMLLTPISCIGCMLGFNWAYMKFMFPRDEAPRLHTLPPIVRISMALGIFFAWVAFIGFFIILRMIVGTDFSSAAAILTYLGVNTALSITAYIIWRKWRIGISNMLVVADAKGSAHWATQEEMKDYVGTHGLYLGGHYRMNHKGHVGLWGSSRSGKNVYILINALLGVGGYKSSFCVLDPKGELASICGPALKRMGKKVVVINPFRLLKDYIADYDTYNPLDALPPKSDPELVDQISVLAEMIIPRKNGDKNEFFINAGRAVLAAIILHLICDAKDSKISLVKIWEVLRLAEEDWNDFILAMATSKDPVHGNTIRRSASEIIKYQGADEMWSGIISNALEATNIFASQAMQESLQSGFDPYSLAADTNTVVFLIIPADKLLSHSAYLRVVTSSLMKAVVKQPGERVTFLIDEAASLGHMSTIENGLSIFAGYNITLFLVYQDLAQCASIYKDRWESVVSNCYNKIFVTQRDNMSLKYIVEALGTKTHVLYKRDFFGNISDVTYEHRPLATLDELKAIFKEELILFTGDNPAVRVPKQPYWENPALYINGKPVFSENPYIDGSK